jgi:hypothetical protein
VALTDEPLVPLREALAYFGRVNGKPPRISTLTRWILRGVRAGNLRVKLEAVRQGVRWMTSRQAVRRFLESTSRHAIPSAPVAQPKKADPHQATINRQLEAVGW